MAAEPADELPKNGALHTHLSLGVDRQIAALHRKAELDGESGELWQQVGLLELKRGRTQQALSALEQASLWMPLSTEAQLGLAGCYVRAGFLETARAIYQHLARAIDLPLECLAAVAGGLERVGRPEVALAVYRDAAQRAPDSAAPQLGIARCLRRLRKPAATVLPYLRRAFDLAPQSNECRILLAWTLHACGRSSDGAELLDVVAVAEVECVPSLTLMRRVYQAACDEQCASACKYRLEALAALRWRERP